MIRLMLTDELWSKLRIIMLQHEIYDKPKLRKTVEGILYRMRTGLPWRDLPSFFGVWISIYQQFNRWSSKNKLINIFKSLVIDPDLEWEFIDGSIVKSHQHSAGAVYISRMGSDSRSRQNKSCSLYYSWGFIARKYNEYC